MKRSSRSAWHSAASCQGHISYRRGFAAVSTVIECFAEEAAIYYQATEDGTIPAVEAEALAGAVDRFFQKLEELEDELC